MANDNVVNIMLQIIYNLINSIISRSCHPTYPLGAGAELKGSVVKQIKSSRATWNIYSFGKTYIAELSFTVGGSVPAFQVKLGTNELNCVDVALNPTHSLDQQ